jgi:hypothetical protein
MTACTPAFARYIGIDYSGAETPCASLKGLRVYQSDGNSDAIEVPPPPSPRKYWTRKEIAAWLVETLNQDIPTLVGIDHGFSFPLRYFEVHQIPPDWPTFLEDFCAHWPTDEDNVYVDFVRDGIAGRGVDRMGNPRWRRITEERCRAKSVFHFDVQGTVAKSTHSGIPWLRYIRNNLGDRVHFWPFDGWEIPDGKSAIAEVYPSLIRHAYPRGDMTGDQHDAYAVACWLRDMDQSGQLGRYLQPSLKDYERAVAGVEGWILGVA